VDDVDDASPRPPREALQVQTDERLVTLPLILGSGCLVAVVLLIVGLVAAALFIPRLTERAETPPPTVRETSGPPRLPGGRLPGRPIMLQVAGPGIGDKAPEINGEDLDGLAFKLSDFQGRVVVLVFWADSSPLCRESYPLQRRLVQRLDKQPFVLLGINRDADREHAKQVVRNEHLSWRSWWDGGQRVGPISRRWSIRDVPTTFVLDSKGVIRLKSEGMPAEALLGQTVDDLLREVPHEKRKE
jgi:peroxiredoxin